MRTLLPLAAVALLAGAPASLAQSDDVSPDAVGPMVTEDKVDTQTFVATVPNANEFEIQSSRLAQEKSASADVKAFAGQMIADHTKVAEDFKAALSQGQTTSSIKPSDPAPSKAVMGGIPRMPPTKPVKTPGARISVLKRNWKVTSGMPSRSLSTFISYRMPGSKGK